MEVKPGYKQTEVGVIPEEWATSSITQASEMTTVGFVGSMSYLFTRSGVPVLRGQDVLPNRLDPTDTKFISLETHNVWKKSALKGGDVVMVRVGASAGTACVIPPNLGEANAASIVVIRPRAPRLDARFLSTVINSDFGKRQVNSLLVGGAQPVINTATVAAFRIPVPPLPEQRAIAEALSDVDGLLGGLDRLIAKKRDLKQAAMQQLLTGQTRLPGFHGEWEVKRLGDVLKVRHGKSQHGITVSDGEYPILASGGEIGRTNTALYDKPSVLIGRKGTIDSPQYTATPFWTVDTLFFTEISACADAKFVFYKFTMIPWRSYNEASGVPSLNAKTIENIEALFPSTKAEQTAIATVLSEMDGELGKLEERREKTRALKQAMMQELLTGRTRLV